MKKLLMAVVVLAGCAGAKPKTARCNEQPQWSAVDLAGVPQNIFVCFGEDGSLLYTVRPVPPAAPVVVNTPAAPAKPAVKKPTRKAAQLPTLGGATK